MLLAGQLLPCVLLNEVLLVRRISDISLSGEYVFGFDGFIIVYIVILGNIL